MSFSSLIHALGALLASHEHALAAPWASVMPDIENAVWDRFTQAAATDTTELGNTAMDAIAAVAQVVPKIGVTAVQFAAGDWQRLRDAHAAATGNPTLVREDGGIGPLVPDMHAGASGIEPPPPAAEDVRVDPPAPPAGGVALNPPAHAPDPLA